MIQSDQSTPVCVDLDGTLIHTDLLLETVLSLLKRQPFYLFMLPIWLLRGKAALKAEIARRVKLTPRALPYNHELLNWLREQKDSGRSLWLCTASNHRLASLVAEHLQIFDGVLASSDDHNLSGRAKAKLLVEKFGAKKFDYCGNHRVDLVIWKNSQGAVVVNGTENLTRAAEAMASLKMNFPKKTGFIKPLFKSLRLHQWAKNLLVFVPLATAHQLGNAIAVQQSIIAFIAFGLCASPVYLMNDMLDLDADRQHPRKCKRPFASGDLSLIFGFILAPALLLATIILASNLPAMFGAVMAGYFVMTIAYSFFLKHLVLLDTILLAGLYTVRIIAGAAAISVPLSFWLLLFSVFLFFSLALVKRYAELLAMQKQDSLHTIGRGYHVEDLPLLHSMGTASSYLAVLVMALYINSPEVESLYRHPQLIWLLCVMLLYWTSRMWIKTHRGEMHDDPVVFALKDKTSLFIGVVAALTVMVAV
jgi:4-hydroxybenzoate polyprenyltransferase/phosphoserine phosphatase